MNETRLSDLKARALDHADMTGSDFPDKDRLTDYANSGLAVLHELLAMHDYFRSVSTIALVTGTEAYQLPNDFYKASRVWRVSNGRRYMLDRFNLAQLDGYTTNGPAFSGVAELWYAPQLKKLVRDKDKVEGVLPNGWDDFVALHMAVQLLNREEQSSAEQAAEREAVRQRIVMHVEPRDTGVPDEIEDHYNRWGGGVCQDDPYRSLRYRILGDKIHFVEFNYLGV